MTPLSKAVAKDTWKTRLIERVVWTFVCLVLARFGYVVTDGFVQASERADATTAQLDNERTAFGSYIAQRLKTDRALEPLIIHCLAEHADGQSHGHPAVRPATEGTYEGGP